MKYIVCAGLMALSVALSACEQEAVNDLSGAAQAQLELVETGKQIAASDCAICHAIGREGSSPREDAPPLRVVLSGFAAEALAADFREHIHVGHQDMPDFEFDVDTTDALMAYLTSIQVAEAPATNP